MSNSELLPNQSADIVSMLRQNDIVLDVKYSGEVVVSYEFQSFADLNSVILAIAQLAEQQGHVLKDHWVLTRAMIVDDDNQKSEPSNL